jgi:hypothetical protein
MNLASRSTGWPTAAGQLNRLVSVNFARCSDRALNPSFNWTCGGNRGSEVLEGPLVPMSHKGPTLVFFVSM